jgi:hypothetical protein
MKVVELHGAKLDAAVALVEGWVPPGDPFVSKWIEDKKAKSPSMDWASLEPLIAANSRASGGRR